MRHIENIKKINKLASTELVQLEFEDIQLDDWHHYNSGVLVVEAGLFIDVIQGESWGTAYKQDVMELILGDCQLFVYDKNGDEVGHYTNINPTEYISETEIMDALLEVE